MDFILLMTMMMNYRFDTRRYYTHLCKNEAEYIIENDMATCIKAYSCNHYTHNSKEYASVGQKLTLAELKQMYLYNSDMEGI